MAETRDLFSQKGSIVDVQLTSKFVSEYFFCFLHFLAKKWRNTRCLTVHTSELYFNSSLTESDLEIQKN